MVEQALKMKTLDQIGIEHQTDKASQFSRTYAKPHDYLRHLEQFVEPWRNGTLKILEIGVGGGESIRTWLEYFENATVVGVDIVRDTNPWNTPGNHSERYRFCPGDQSSPVFWASFVRMFGKEWDLVIDDGSHASEDIIMTFGAMFHQLRSGGIYVIEDLKSALKAAAWLGTESVEIHTGKSDIDSIYFARELAILRKR